MSLREVHKAAVRKWERAGVDPRWTRETALRLQEAQDAHEEALKLYLRNTRLPVSVCDEIAARAASQP